MNENCMHVPASYKMLHSSQFSAADDCGDEELCSIWTLEVVRYRFSFKSLGFITLCNLIAVELFRFIYYYISIYDNHKRTVIEYHSRRPRSKSNSFIFFSEYSGYKINLISFARSATKANTRNRSDSSLAKSSSSSSPKSFVLQRLCWCLH